jgi:hypothetical protein
MWSVGSQNLDAKAKLLLGCWESVEQPIRGRDEGMIEEMVER